MRVLIADDEAIIRMGLKAMLEDMGHQVIGAAADGTSAVRLARSLQPDLVILDIKMPGLDGLQAAEAIASERPVPILVLSAYSDWELVQRAASLAVYGYLVKPIRPAEMESALEIAVSRFGRWRALQQEAGRLQETLSTREIVERAKQVLMERDSLTEKEAFHRIQGQARRERRSMRAVAEEVLSAKQQLTS